jgi:hypothetical protein
MPLQMLDDLNSEQPVLNTVLAAWAIQLTGTLNRTLPKETYEPTQTLFLDFVLDWNSQNMEGRDPPRRETPSWKMCVRSTSWNPVSICARSVSYYSFGQQRRAMFQQRCG